MSRLLNATPLIRQYLADALAGDSIPVYTEGLPSNPPLSLDVAGQLTRVVVIHTLPSSREDNIPVSHPSFRIVCYDETKAKARDFFFDVMEIIDHKTITTDTGRVAVWLNIGPNILSDQNNYNYADCYMNGIAKAT